MTSDEDPDGIGRRTLLGAAAATAASAVLPRAAPAAAGQSAAAPIAGRPLQLTINGKTHSLALDPRVTLLDALREHLNLTGTKKGCDQGQCGACTVLLDGTRVLACFVLALAAEGRDITTIEGLALPDGGLHPMQQALIDHDAFQCGYCTPGQIMSAVGCVAEDHAGSDADIREYMSGNLCRCAAYPNIVAAIRQARAQMETA